MSDEAAADPNVLEIEADGKKWRLGRIRFEIRLDAEEEIRKRRRVEFKEACVTISGLPDMDKDTATLAAFDNLLRNIIVSTRDANGWLGTPSGEMHQLWKSLQKTDPAATPEQARELLGAMTTDQYAKVQDFWAVGLGSHRVVSLSNDNYATLKELLKLED